MRTKKVKVLLIAIIIILQTVLPTLSYAVDTMKLNIQETRPFSDDDGDGETNDDVYKLKKNVNEQEVTESIFKIYDVDDKDIDESLLYSKALYCLRGGLGFGNVQYIEELQNNEVTYTNFGDMKTNAISLISSYNTNTNSNIDASYTIGENTFTPYNAILWIVDNMYVHSTDAEQNTIQKQFLNEKINKYNEAYTILNLTEDDIEVVQQLALWYFSNYNDGIYSLSDTVYLGNAITINEKDMVDVSKSRYKEITYLFEYLKNTAIQNAYKYGSENIRKINTDELTISFDETVKSKINEGTEDYYFVGPFKIDQVGGNTGYTNFELKFTITAIDSEGKSSVVNPTYYYISNAEGTRLQTTLKDMINWREDDGEFYLAIKKEYQAISGATLGYEVAELEFNVEYSYQYNESEASLWMTNSNDDQPVLLVERELLSKNDSSKVSIKDIAGNFALKLEKYDEDENLLKGANFTLETLDRENIPLTNNNDGTFKTGTIGIKEDGQSFIYELTETVVPDGYIGLNDSVRIKIETGLNKGETEYIVTDAYFIDESGQKITNEKLKISVNDTASLITIKIKNILIKSFDLALRKYITKVNDETYSREPVVDTSTIATTGTATYKHSKKPISVKKGDIVTYTIRVYNEGGLDGYVEEITDYLPDNLLPIIEDLNSIASKKYKDEIEFNNKWLWTYSEKENTIKTTITSKSNSEKYAILTGLENVADTKLDAYVEGSNKLDYIDVQIKCLVKESNQILTGTYLTNIAEISKMCDENGVEQETDRDSTKENVDHTNLSDYKNKEALNSTEDSYIPGQEDDDDFEKLIIEVYDLSLRKFITNINRNGTAISIGNSREPNVDTTTLLNLTSTTATYNHKKDPVEVQVGDIVTYTIRVYNEGTIDGIPAEITEYIPTYLDFNPNDELNKKYGWELVDNYTNNGVGVLKTTYFKDTVLKAFSYQEGDSLDNTSNYAVGDLKINFIVNSTAEIGTIMTNTSEISIYQNAEKEQAIDRDSGEQWEIGIIDYGINLMNNALYTNYVQTGEITQEKADEISKYVEIIMVDYKPDYTSSDYGISAYLDSKGITAENFVANAPEGVPEEILLEAYKIINSGNSNQEITKAYAEYINEFFQSYKGIVSNKNDLTDSQYYYVGQEDDDDFEKLIIKTEKFDLALRKYIKAINNEDLSGQDSRVPKIDTTSLKDESSTTATYTHSKTPLTVKKGDIITYTIRIYNEGKLDGFASEITDYIPEGLGYILNYKQNTDNAWLVEDSKETTVIPLIGENGLYQNSESVNNLSVENFYETESLEDVNIVKGKAKIKTSALDDEEIKGYGKTKEDKDKWQASVNDTADGLFYQEIDIVCIVLAENNCQDVLRNIAEITEDVALDEKGNEVQIDDRDSTPDNADLNNYKYKEENSTYQEDDDDYEPIQLKYFDLALRKFITAVEDKEITSRIPTFYIDEDGNYKYEHSKEPVEVANGDEVTYTIRIFNEGTIAGYAEEIEDDIPEGLIFLPENETNKKYAWKMYREIAQDEEIGADKSIVTKNGKTYVETEDASEAVIIRTEYLSEANGSISEDGINSNLIKAYNSETMKDGPDYRDVKVVFKVSEKEIPEDNTDRIITNRAHITEDSDDDFDSTPNEWNEGEDDQDIEHVYVKEFDLALFKWVTKTIVKVDGKTTTRETGFKPNTGLTEQEGEEYRNNKESEPIASVTIDKKKLDKTEVKFVYKIKVVNEGEIAGYATEIRDYIPTGLKFIAEDNPLWKDEGDNVISTRALETKLLEPGQSEELEIVFTWINGADNLGLKTNIAAIVEDYNEKGAEDVDSDPGNENIPEYNKEQEDDDDYALVILVLKTGAEKTYIELVLLVVAILTVGIILIKKYAIK